MAITGITETGVQGPGPQDHRLHIYPSDPSGIRNRPAVFYDDFMQSTISTTLNGLQIFEQITSGATTAGGDSHTHTVNVPRIDTTTYSYHLSSGGTCGFVMDSPGAALMLKSSDTDGHSCHVKLRREPFTFYYDDQPLYYECMTQHANPAEGGFSVILGNADDESDITLQTNSLPTRGISVNGVGFTWDPKTAATAGDGATDGIAFKTSINGTVTTTDTETTPVAGEDMVFSMAYNGDGPSGAPEIKAYINGELVATHTTNIPNESNDHFGPVWETCVRDAGDLSTANSNKLYVKYIYVSQERSAAAFTKTLTSTDIGG